MKRACFPDFARVTKNNPNLREAGIFKRWNREAQAVPFACDEWQRLPMIIIFMVIVIDKNRCPERIGGMFGNVDGCPHSLPRIKQRRKRCAVVIGTEFAGAIMAA